MTKVLRQRPASLPLSLACRALELNRSMVYARQKATQSNQQPRASRKHCRQPRALSEKERGKSARRYTAKNSATSRRLKSSQRCLSKGATCARKAPCIACYGLTEVRVTAASSGPPKAMLYPGCWPHGQTKFGRGISPNSRSRSAAFTSRPTW
jgi:hypothetical protein